MAERIGKWLTAEERPSASGKTRVFALHPRTDRKKADGMIGGPVGFVGWYGPWRKYALQPESNTVFEADCLAALAEFCARKTREHLGATLVRVRKALRQQDPPDPIAKRSPRHERSGGTDGRARPCPGRDSTRCRLARGTPRRQAHSPRLVPPNDRRGTHRESAGVRERWVFQVRDATLVPRSFCAPDERAIRAAVNAGVREIPGVAIYLEESVAVRVG